MLVSSRLSIISSAPLLIYDIPEDPFILALRACNSPLSCYRWLLFEWF